MRDHLFAEEYDGQWRLTGLIDFEPAMIGDPEYDFASVALFVSCGDIALFRAFFAGYGYTDADLTDALRKRIMGYILAHRYSNLPWYLSFMPGSESAATIADLEKAWLSF